MDVSCKQLTVDFVNQSVAHAGLQDPESRHSEKTDFAERLGAMNRRWQILQGRLSEQVSFLPPPQEGALWFCMQVRVGVLFVFSGPETVCGPGMDGC